MPSDHPQSPATENFAAELDRLGLSQLEAAKRLGVHARQVDRWYHGRNEPTFRTLVKWGEEFDRTPMWFLEDHSEQREPNGDSDPVAA